MKLLHLLAWMIAMALPVAAQKTPAPTPVPTAAGPIQMELASPLALTTKPLVLTARFGRWFPVAVLLTNSGPPVAGEVRLRLGAPGGFASSGEPNEFYSRVELPTTSRKIVWLYGRLERQETTTVEVSFAGRGFRALREEVEMRSLDSPQRLVVNITEGGDNLGYLANMRGLGQGAGGGNVPGSASQAVRPVGATRELVPDKWLGLEAADVVVLGDFPHAQLLPNQVEALRGYVAGGGTLLAPGGARWQRLAQSPLASLWPLKLTGVQAAPASQVVELAGRYMKNPRHAGDRLGGAPLLLASGVPASPGTATGAPHLFRKRYGAGQVLMPAYDFSQPPFLSWDGLPDMWREILRLSARSPQLATVEQSGNWGGNQGRFGWDETQDESPTQQLLNGLSRAQQLQMPPMSQIAWFLSLYILVLVPVNYGVLSLLQRRELAWVTVPVIVLVFSGIAYQAAANIRGRSILSRQVDVVQATLGTPQARVDSMMWIFSPRRAYYDIASQTKNAAVAEYVTDASRQASVSIFQPGDTGSFEVENSRILQWTDRPYVGQSIADLKGGLQLSEGNDPVLQNRTPFRLEGVLWVRGQEVRLLGALAAGQSRNLAAGKAVKLKENAEFSALVKASSVGQFLDSRLVTNDVPRLALVTVRNRLAGGAREQGYVLAWARDLASPLQFAEQPSGGKCTVFVFRRP